jgi:hypothetical protein
VIACQFLPPLAPRRLSQGAGISRAQGGSLTPAPGLEKEHAPTCAASAFARGVLFPSKCTSNGVPAHCPGYLGPLPEAATAPRHYEGVRTNTSFTGNIRPVGCQPTGRALVATQGFRDPPQLNTTSGAPTHWKPIRNP